jgi:hypothetical protein
MGLFSGGDGVSARDQAVEKITGIMSMLLEGHIKAKVLPEVACDGDGYIAGYIYGKILSFILYFQKVDGLPAEDTNVVTGMVLLNVFGEADARQVSNAMRGFVNGSSQDFENGKQKGAILVAYSMQAKDARSDPDYSRALTTGRSVERRLGQSAGSNDLWAAVAGFEALWFGDRMADYY